MRRNVLHAALVASAVAILALIGYIIWSSYAETRLETLPDDGGSPVTQVVTARLAGASALKVAELTGTVQATASDTRGMGMLRSDQTVKMPYSVGYFVDLSQLGSRQLEWNGQTRTLIVDAPDIVAAPANTDEGRRTMVETNGVFVTRKAGETLSRQTSARATAVAEREAKSPERMAQARELGRAAIARLLAQPLAAAGMGEVRVVVTFPPERVARGGERWDVSRSPGQVVQDIEARNAN